MLFIRLSLLIILIQQSAAASKQTENGNSLGEWHLQFDEYLNLFLPC